MPCPALPCPSRPAEACQGDPQPQGHRRTQGSLSLSTDGGMKVIMLLLLLLLLLVLLVGMRSSWGTADYRERYTRATSRVHSGSVEESHTTLTSIAPKSELSKTKTENVSGKVRNQVRCTGQGTSEWIGECGKK
ncbi:hypothetical protein E2C01_080666 [Portunus trituberculatus]|uniref:Uncharacterized protein n=1 Tax=Portunus trituberculatus TaxID=210409 RepID=A0A5B7IWQ5_PORTR|nr:hypothetical protein [Portunus trituberculatus]